MYENISNTVSEKFWKALTDGRVKWIEDFYLEEAILFQIRQYITESGDPDKLLEEEEKQRQQKRGVRRKCRDAEEAYTGRRLRG